MSGLALLPLNPPVARGEHPAPVILLVDDSGLMRSFVKELLTEAGYQVLEACDAQDALEITRTTLTQIDLLITDLMLPVTSGLDLARKLRAERPDLKVLLVSADPSYAPAAALLPHAGFMDKNQIMERLTETVAQILTAAAGG